MKHVTDFTILADLATDGFWEWYPALNYEYMSERFWSILGYSQGEMDESPDAWVEKIDSDDARRAMANFTEHSGSRGAVPYYLTVKYRHKDGHVVHIVCRGSVEEWLPDGTPWRIIGTHTDVTDIVMKDSLRAREQFVSRMSHEIRSPLCAVLNECDLLGNKYDLSVIKDSCTQILYIANDILSLDKLKSNAMVLDAEPCDPEEVIASSIKRHRREFKKKGLRLSSSMDDMPPLISLDRAKFNQILDNILSNALKYTNKGSVSIDCGFDCNSSMLSVTVEDTGVGIPADEQGKIFDEFFQGSKSMRGIGIGLHIVTVLSKFLGGKIEVVRSEVGEGTTMRFGVVAEVLSPSDEEQSATTKTLRVLVVDDIATNRKYLDRKLQGMEDAVGLKVTEVVEACDGKDAVRVFEKSDDRFDVVLMDCLMPIMDGFQATKEIHSVCDKKEIPRVPVVAVTASIADNIYQLCQDAGMTCVVTKPFSPEQLYQSIEKSKIA
ncbi:Histidine kinase-like protein [Ectocarpus siliculosus]|uniref:histidine kinase n=1 Tax=Ectocarpus siliculosus TaxID=2880 RepID=D8LPJ7_ECTSI|nr:Histidine kinase-like protein [Ectocarpus siliculosus]|eukprot:CBN80469.1 Histidine kinase-like protein [Ectocarpus siliculosus]